MKKAVVGIVATLTLLGQSALAETAGDPVAGEKSFRKCLMCHTIGEGAVHRTGPELNNVFGRVAGTDNGFKYSEAMIAAGKNGLVWSPEKLDEFISNPRHLVPKTKMTLASIRDAQERANIVAYVARFSAPAPQSGEAAQAEAPAENAAPATSN
jgi:cytochrome c